MPNQVYNREKVLTQQGAIVSENFDTLSGGDKLAQQARAQQLIKFLPYGCLSKEMFDALMDGEEKAKYRFVNKGYVEKRRMTRISTFKRNGKYDYYYLLTPAGLRYIKNSGLKIPLWMEYVAGEEFKPGRQVISEREHARLIASQDLIAFFTSTNTLTMLSDLWNCDANARKYIFGIIKSRYSNESPVALCAYSALGYIEPSKDSPFSLDVPLPKYENINALIQGLNPDHIRQIGFRSNSELNLLYRMLSSNDDDDTMSERQNVKRDNTSGIYAGTHQDFVVYLSQQAGTYYSYAITASAKGKVSLYAALASLDNSLPIDYQCTTALVIVRNIKEFVNTIVDPYHLRATDNRQFGKFYKEVHVIPVAPFGMHLVNTLDTYVNPSSSNYMTSKAKLGLMVPGPEANLSLDSSQTIILRDNETVFNGTLFSLKEIYECMIVAEAENRKVPIICSFWQEEYFRALEECWLKNPLMVDTTEYYPEISERRFGFELIPGKNLTASWDTWPSKFKTPMTVDEWMKTSVRHGFSQAVNSENGNTEDDGSGE